MNENTYQTEMNLTQRLMAEDNAPKQADTAVSEVVVSTEKNVTEKAAPAKKSKGGRKKKVVVNERDMLTKRLTELLSAAEENVAEGKKINDEIDTIRKRLHEIELADLDGICTSKGISTQEIIEFMRGINDISQLKNNVGNGEVGTQ